MPLRTASLAMTIGIALVVSAAPLPALAATPGSAELTTVAAIPSPAAVAVGLIVRYAPGVIPVVDGDVAGDAGVSETLTAGKTLGKGLRTVKFDQALTADDAKKAAAQLEASPLVLDAIPDYVYQLADDLDTQELTPPAPRSTIVQSSAPWGLGRIDQPALGAGDDTYNYDTTGEGVTAYIIDTGIRRSHNEFTGRVEDGYFSSQVTSTDDCNGHGTHVAGTVGGVTYGVAKSVTIVPVRVFTCAGTTSTSYIFSALLWIIDDHLPGEPAVINMSLGVRAVDEWINYYVQEAINDGITVVVSAGNSAEPSCANSPASAPNAITVNASTSSDTAASFTNFGPCSDIYAPGVSIESALWESDTASGFKSGTSMASPHVAGVVARILSNAPDLSPAEVAAALLGSAVDVAPAGPPTSGSCSGGSSAYSYDCGPDASAFLQAPLLTAFQFAPVPTIEWADPPVSARAVAGDWTQTTSADQTLTPQLAYQWNRSGAPIAGATDVNYLLTSSDSSGPLSVTVTAFARGYNTLAKTSGQSQTGVPSAPITLTVIANPGSVALAWAPPSMLNGGTITDYLVKYRASGTGTWLPFADGTHPRTGANVTGLSGGRSYEFSVQAVTYSGVGVVATVIGVTRTGLASAPRSLTSAARARSVKLVWTAPSTVNGGTITDYVVKYRLSGTSTWSTFVDGTSTRTYATATGLIGGRTYQFTVAAKSVYGTGATASAVRVTLTGLASAPRSLRSTSLTRGVKLAWTAPSTTQGGTITDYVVKYRLSGARTWRTFADGTSARQYATVTGLSSRRTYEFTVAAKTAFGTGSTAATTRAAR
jgi:subtilisin family serine protease